MPQKKKAVKASSPARKSGPGTGSRKKSTLSAAAETPAASAQPQPATVALQAPVRSLKAFLWAGLILVVIAIIGVEVFFALKNKASHQGSLVNIRYFGERGEWPDKLGKYYGVSRLRIDDQHNRICVVDDLFAKVLFWDLQTGAHIADLDNHGSHQLVTPAHATTGDFNPINGDLDGQGNLLVIDKLHARALVITPDLKTGSTFPIIPSDKLAVGKSGDFYVTDTATLQIAHYSPQGKLLTRFGGNQLSNPLRMGTDEKGNLFVYDSNLKKIIGFTPEGKNLVEFSPRLNPFGDLDMEVRNGLIYFSVYESKCLYIYTTQGKLLWEVQLPYPADIAVDDNGLLYLAGSSGIGLFRLQKRF